MIRGYLCSLTSKKYGERSTQAWWWEGSPSFRVHTPHFSRSLKNEASRTATEILYNLRFDSNGRMSLGLGSYWARLRAGRSWCGTCQARQQGHHFRMAPLQNIDGKERCVKVGEERCSRSNQVSCGRHRVLAPANSGVLPHTTDRHPMPSQASFTKMWQVLHEALPRITLS